MFNLISCIRWHTHECKNVTSPNFTKKACSTSGCDSVFKSDRHEKCASCRSTIFTMHSRLRVLLIGAKRIFLENEEIRKRIGQIGMIGNRLSAPDDDVDSPLSSPIQHVEGSTSSDTRGDEIDEAFDVLREEYADGLQDFPSMRRLREVRAFVLELKDEQKQLLAMRDQFVRTACDRKSHVSLPDSSCPTHCSLRYRSEACSTNQSKRWKSRLRTVVPCCWLRPLLSHQNMSTGMSLRTRLHRNEDCVIFR